MSIIEQIEQGGNGNTNSPSEKKKQIIQCKQWCFTYNNYPADFHTIIDPVLNVKCNKYVYGQEVGASGTPHLQGSIWLKTKARPSELGLPKNIHWEKMRNEKASIEYCQKDGLVTMYGFPKPIKTLTSLRPWQAALETLVTGSEPDGRSIHWHWENVGGVGKSSFCKYMYIKHKTVVIQGGKLADIMNIIFNTDMNEVTAVIIDVPRVNQNKVSYAAIECILNGMITNTKYETGIKVFNPPHVIVFSNFEPETDKLSDDRWQVTNIV